MSQKEMIEVGVQVEAVREMVVMVRPLVQKIIRGAVGLRQKGKGLAALQSKTATSGTAQTPIAPVQVQEGR